MSVICGICARSFRATLDLVSKSSKCGQCGQRVSARITGNPEVMPLDHYRETPQHHVFLAGIVPDARSLADISDSNRHPVSAVAILRNADVTPAVRTQRVIALI